VAEKRPYAQIRVDTWVCPYAGEDTPFDRLRANGGKGYSTRIRHDDLDGHHEE